MPASDRSIDLDLESPFLTGREVRYLVKATSSQMTCLMNSGAFPEPAFGLGPKSPRELLGVAPRRR